MIVTVKITPCLNGRPAWPGDVVKPGGCNSSHGGSCCTCGGPLPLPHTHISITVGDQPKWRTGAMFGGNTCSDECTYFFQEWATKAPEMEICPGHGRIPVWRSALSKALEAEIMARIRTDERLPYLCPCCGRALNLREDPTTSRWDTIGGGFAVCAEHVQAAEFCRTFGWEHSGRMDTYSLPLITWSQSSFDSWAINTLRESPEIAVAIIAGADR